MLPRLIFTVSVLTLLAAAGCAANLDDKLGSASERCHVDDDCQEGLVCDRGLCGGGAGNNGRNNGENNGDAEIEDLCKEVCEYVEECTGAIDEECTWGCVDQLLEAPRDVALDLLYCLLDLSCRELQNGGEQCFEVDLAERAQFCEDVSKFVADEFCPRQGVGEEMYELCIDAAQWHDDENFWQLEECLGTDECSDILECTYDWYENG